MNDDQAEYVAWLEQMLRDRSLHTKVALGDFEPDSYRIDNGAFHDLRA